MSEYKIGQKIWRITISKYKDERSQWSVGQDGLKIEETSILGISKYKIVLDNDFFTTLNNDSAEGYRKDRSINNYINDISVNIRANSGIFDNGVFVSLYSTVPPNGKLLKTMVKAAEKEINKKYGFLFGGVVEELNKYVEDYGNMDVD